MSYRSLKTNQRLERELAFKVTGTGTAAINIGSGLGTLVDNGTGDWTITFARAFARAPICIVSPITAAGTLRTVSTTTTVQVLGFNQADGTTAKDMVFNLLVKGWDTADEFSEAL